MTVIAVNASLADPGLDGHRVTSQSDPHAGLMSLGEIADAHYRVLIFSGPEGPVYSVSDTQTGQTLGTLLTAEQVSERFPELPLPDMDYDTADQFSIVEGAFHLPGQ